MGRESLQLSLGWVKVFTWARAVGPFLLLCGKTRARAGIRLRAERKPRAAAGRGLERGCQKTWAGRTFSSGFPRLKLRWKVGTRVKADRKHKLRVSVGTGLEMGCLGLF